MPEKITDFNSISVGIGSVVALLLSYALYIISSIKGLIESLKKEKDKEVEEIKKDFEEEKIHNRDMHNKHYDDIHDLKTIQAVMKTQQDMGKKGGS